MPGRHLLTLVVLSGIDLPAMTQVAGGSFVMGSARGYADERPLHTVSVEGFEISRTEITVSQYTSFKSAPPEASRDKNRPITFVSRADAERYGELLSDHLGHACRLPSEAEWEYAARVLYGIANSRGIQEESIASLEPSTGPETIQTDLVEGAHGILGNVAEWVQDCYHPDYSGAPTDGSARLHCEYDLAVVRGGSWADPPKRRTITARNDFAATERSDRIGFRILCELDQ